MNPQQIAALKNDLLADKFSKALNEQMFPDERLSPEWVMLARKAIKKSSPLKSRISLSEFVKVIGNDITDNQITMFQFGIHSNAVEELTFEESGMSIERYVSVLTEASDHIKYYNAQIKIIQERIQKEVEEEVKLRLAVSENGGILKSIKGEA